MGEAAARTCKKAIRLASGLLDTAVLLAVTLLLAAGCYALWDSDKVYRDADAARYAIYKPTAEGGEPSFDELKAINPEVFAWITVYGTHIDYPVAQGNDNMKYVNTNAKGNYSLSGAIFLDADAKQDFSDFASVLYGHHMEKNAMFGELGRFADRAFFDERAYGSLYAGGREYGLAFFAFLHTDAYDNAVFRSGITGKKESENYLGTIGSKASHTRDISVSAEDRIILLSTCSASSTNGRDILVARVTDETYEDAFGLTETLSFSAPSADRLVSLWKLVPLWAKLASAAALLAALAAFLTARLRRGRAG
jgi:sortase B